MRALSLLLTGVQHLEWLAEDLSQPGPGEVLVRTVVGAISIGSELPRYTGSARSSVEATYPVMTGYENVGVVVQASEGSGGLRVGSRVVATFGHRTHAIIRATKAIAVPDGIDDEVALLAILTCDVAKGIRKLAPLPEEQVLVTGGGAIGLLTVAMLRAYGVASVDVVEPLEARRQLALLLGARQALAPEQGDELADDYSAGLECSSSNAGFALLQGRMRREGRICILADGNIKPLVLAPEFHERELRVVGSSDGWDYQQHARWFFSLPPAQLTKLRAIFEHRTTPSALPSTFAQLADGSIAPTKVLVDYSDVSGV